MIIGALLKIISVETQLGPKFYRVAYVNLGVAYRVVNQLDLAIESYTVMIALDPNSRATYEAYNNRGLSLS